MGETWGVSIYPIAEIEDVSRPSTVSLTLILSQRERESFSVPIYTHTTNKALRKFGIRVNSYPGGRPMPSAKARGSFNQIKIDSALGA